MNNHRLKGYDTKNTAAFQLAGCVIPLNDTVVFDVVCFQVNYDSNRILNDPLSPLLETREQAQVFLADIKKIIPTAKIGKYTFEYLSADDRDRRDILKTIVRAGGNNGL